MFFFYKDTFSATRADPIFVNFDVFFHFYRKINAFVILANPFEILTKTSYRKIMCFPFLLQINAFVILNKPLEIFTITFKYFVASVQYVVVDYSNCLIEKWFSLCSDAKGNQSFAFDN